jgi:hypothetical protein
VRLGKKRTAINGTFVVRLYKRTAKALFLLLVLVTLPCVFRKTHGKVTIAIYFFCFSRSKTPKNLVSMSNRQHNLICANFKNFKNLFDNFYEFY